MEAIEMIKAVRGGLKPANLPDGFTLKTYEESYAGEWINICYELNGKRYLSREQFFADILGNAEVAPERMFFIIAPFETAVSTASACINSETNTGTLSMVATVGDFKKKGLAYAACMAAISCLEESGVEKIRLFVDPANIPAMKLFESLGFVRA